MKNFIVIELDNVICNTTARQHLLNEGWSDYHSALETDTPNEAIVQILKSLDFQGYEILVVSGRPAKYDLQTLKWLSTYEVPVDEILLREDWDFRSEIDVKLDLLDSFFGSRQEVLDNVIVAFNNNEKVIEAFRSAGIETWQV